MELQGDVVIVTGGGQGIGRAVCLELAEQGARVIVVDRSESTGNEVAKECDGRFVRADVVNSTEVDRAVSYAMEAHGRLDGLVNNAGITRPVDLLDIDDQHWSDIQAVNATGTFYFLRAAARQMRLNGGGGSIVNMSSIAAKGYRNTSSVAYAASKGSIIGLTRASAMQLAKYSIRVNAICPGITMTPLVAPRLKANPNKLADIPLGIANLPEDIGALAAFLLSKRARTVTGQSWNVDGGIVFD